MSATGETSSTGPSTTTTGSSSTSDPSTTEDPTTTTTDTTGTTPASECGNGIVEAGEACDDGNRHNNDACLNTCEVASCGDGVIQKNVEECDDGNDSDTDICLSTCVEARCGDGFVQKGLEECDEGPDNAFGVYDGCTPFCTFGPRCGDGLLDDGEQCDDGNDGDPADGCLDGCVSAVSCLSIKEGIPDAESGIYLILPDVDGVDTAFDVWCDMETDGGGYTFLKIDTAKDPNSPPLSAKLAEVECGKYGLQLFTPRTSNHAEAAYYLSVSDNVSPVGGGVVSADPAYMSILAIYPVIPGQTCVDKALNSDDCPQWQAGDEGPYWVSSSALNGQPSKSNCSECSMYYEWSQDGTILTYIALGQGGFSSPRFLCDAGDKTG